MPTQIGGQTKWAGQGLSNNANAGVGVLGCSVGDECEERDESNFLGVIASVCHRLDKDESGVQRTREFMCLNLKINVTMFVIVINVFVIVVKKISSVLKCENVHDRLDS